MVIIEIQSTQGVTSCITSVHADRSEAEQKYHQALSYAAVSSVEIHSVAMLDEYGTLIKRETYNHGSIPVE